MSSFTPASERALHLPEIIAIICQQLDEDISFLRTCLYINKTWAQEALKHMWKNCGAGYRGSGLKTPEIRHLAGLAPDFNRMQFYAHMVHELWFRIEADRDHRPSDGSKDETRYHELFQTIEFSRLDTLMLVSSRFSVAHNTAVSIRPYLQPKLKELSIYFCEPLSEALLLSIKVQALHP